MTLLTTFTCTFFFLLSSRISVLSFSPQLRPFRSTSTARFGLAEWRDLDHDFPGKDIVTNVNEQGGLPKSICILPFSFTDVLLQGETKQLRLYEERFIHLFQDAMENHCGVVAMGLLADSGIIQTVPICEVEAYNRMEGFGIFVTIRVVARAQLLEITKQEPYIRAACLEINDKIPPNLDFPNLVASNIENFMVLLSSMEHRLAKAKQGQNRQAGEADEEESDMQRRMNIAKLVSPNSVYDTAVCLRNIIVRATSCDTLTHTHLTNLRFFPVLFLVIFGT
jgi:Lon protease-like protein